MTLTELLREPFVRWLVVAAAFAWVHLALATWRRFRRWRRRKPILLALFVIWVGLLLRAVTSAATMPQLTPPPTPEAPVRGIADVPSSTCVVYGFPDAESFLPASVNDQESQRRKLERLPQDPSGCIVQLLRWLKAAHLHQLVISGRADRRPLTVDAQGRVVSNESLALDRARAVFAWVADRAKADGAAVSLDARTLIQVSGVRYASKATNAMLLEQDRSVEIRGFWDRALPRDSAQARIPEAGSTATLGVSLNRDAFDPDVSIAVLSLFVALSAYLATVGYFIRQRAFELQSALHTFRSERLVNPNSFQRTARRRLGKMLGRRYRQTQTYLMLLQIADMPMILAAFSMTMHVFFLQPASWLRVGMVFAAFSVLIMIGQHAGQWIGTMLRLFRSRAS